MTEGADEKLLLPVERGGEAELPSDWKGYEPFIEQWRAMEPIFEDVAVLRAAMFLSRDVMAPAVARSGLSQHFTGIEIVSEKTRGAYERVFTRYGVAPVPVPVSR